MTKRTIAMGLMVFGVLACSSAIVRADCPPDVNTGSWSPAKEFTSSELVPSAGCSRMYYCGPTESIMYDSSCRIVATPAISVGGVCSAGGGDPSSCNACLTNPPSDTCQWHLEPK